MGPHAVAWEQLDSFATLFRHDQRPQSAPSVRPTPARRFDTIYVDDRIRVAQDSRGDTLVVARDGPPRRFT